MDNYLNPLMQFNILDLTCLLENLLDFEKGVVKSILCFKEYSFNN